jgi:hypothetical protein
VAASIHRSGHFQPPRRDHPLSLFVAQEIGNPGADSFVDAVVNALRADRLCDFGPQGVFGRDGRWLMRRIVCLMLGLAAASSANAATYTVSSTADVGANTLRQAILDANANVNVVDLIVFALPGPSFTIKPMSPLPTITDPVTIDGYTQNGSGENMLAVGTNAVLVVEIDGSMAGDADGLLIEHVTNLGAGTTIRGLVINRFANNGRAAIRINDDGNNLIEGNFLGTDRSGLLALGNGDGVSIALLADDNQIGGTIPAARNLISGNTTRGVVLDTDDNVVEGNLIGTDATGVVGLGNGVGIFLFNFAADNRIGNLGLVFNPAANTISGNLNGGIIVGTGSTGHDILGNRIGVAADGITVLGNGFNGAVQVGGNSTTLINNQIAGPSTGISINQVSNTLVQGNIIGLLGFGMGGAGVFIVDGTDNLIGGTIAEGNIISGNGGPGVQVVRFSTPATGNAILTNSITANGGLGIELINGANGGQPAPVLSGASGGTRVQGTLTAAASTTYQIQVFANPVCDRFVGGGEGEEFLGSFTVTTDGGGVGGFDEIVAAAPNKPFITATATDPNNNTSQFSNCVLNPDAIIAPAPALGHAALAATLLLLVGIGRGALRRQHRST